MPFFDPDVALREIARLLSNAATDVITDVVSTVTDAITMPQFPPSVANGIQYPAGDSTQLHLRWDEISERYLIRLFERDGSPNDHLQTQDLDEVYRGAVHHMQFTMQPGLTIFPRLGSAEYSMLADCAVQTLNARSDQERQDQEFMNEDRMPITSRVTAPDQFSFIIKWEGRRQCYMIIPPLTTRYVEEGYEVISESVGDLNEAYRRALAFASQYRRHSTQPTSYHVWPRRNSNAYRDLISAPHGSNPTNIASYALVKEIVANIVTNPTDPVNETMVKDLVEYLLFKRYGAQRGYNADQVIGVLNTVSLLLQSKTGVEWERAEDTSWMFIHPANAIRIHTDPTHLEYTQLYSTRGRISDCRACTSCDNWFHRRSVIKPNREDDNVQLCKTCLASSGWYKCSLCDNKYHHEERGCPEYARMPVGHVYNYSQDVRAVVPKMFHEPEDVAINGTHRRYGVELEVFYRDGLEQSGVRNTVGNAIKGHAIMKHDSSLNGRGFEIVTAPATLAYHRKHLWNKFFALKNTDNRTAAQSVWAWNTKLCGLHVHITRAAMTEMQVAKLCVFYHDNVNGAFLSKIAGREVGPNARYCKALKKKLYYNRKTGEGTINDCRSHHDAITISERNNGKTAEVRIFRANATRHGIMRAIEFVDATVAWCGQSGASGLTFHNFLQWFDSPTVRTKYPDLWRHLIEMRYLTTKHKASTKHTIKKVKYTGDKAQKLTPLTDEDKVA